MGEVEEWPRHPISQEPRELLTGALASHRPQRKAVCWGEPCMSYPGWEDISWPPRGHRTLPAQVWQRTGPSKFPVSPTGFALAHGEGASALELQLGEQPDLVPHPFQPSAPRLVLLSEEPLKESSTL